MCSCFFPSLSLYLPSLFYASVFLSFSRSLLSIFIYVMHLCFFPFLSQLSIFIYVTCVFPLSFCLFSISPNIIVECLRITKPIFKAMCKTDKCRVILIIYFFSLIFSFSQAEGKIGRLKFAYLSVYIYKAISLVGSLSCLLCVLCVLFRCSLSVSICPSIFMTLSVSLYACCKVSETI